MLRPVLGGILAKMGLKTVDKTGPECTCVGFELHQVLFMLPTIRILDTATHQDTFVLDTAKFTLGYLILQYICLQLIIVHHQYKHISKKIKYTVPL